MSSTYTTSSVFTRTNARKLASKVISDLSQVNDFYGKPSVEKINQYYEELVILLTGDSGGGYLESVEYGFKKQEDLVFGLRYDVTRGGDLVTDDRPGRIPANEDTSDAEWFSLITYSDHFLQLSEVEKNNIKESLPFSRGFGTEPSTNLGTWYNEKIFTSGGVSLERRVFKTF